MIIDYLADLSGDQIAEPIEPRDVRFQIPRLLHILKRRFQIGVLLGERLNKLLRSNITKPLQFNVRQLLGQQPRAGAQLRHFSLKSLIQLKQHVIEKLTGYFFSQGIFASSPVLFFLFFISALGRFPTSSFVKNKKIINRWLFGGDFRIHLSARMFIDLLAHLRMGG